MPPSTPSPYLTTAQTARALGVSVSTVKRWVDHGVLPAHVTAGGHRKLLRPEVLALARQGRLPAGEPPVLPDPRADAATISAALVAALVAGRSPDARAVVRGALDAGHSLDAIADRVIAPAMAEVGHGWERGRVDVWEEHRATEVCAAALYDLRGELERRAERDRPLAIGGAPAGDPYTLPSLLAQFVLLDSGWEAVNLGPNTPLSNMARAVRELRPRLLWMSASYLADERDFLRAYGDLYRAAEGLGVTVVVGGRGLAAGIRASMPYAAYGDGLAHLAAFARSLHPRPRRPARGRPRLDARPLP
jgi:excisionase family DNA binding protein